MDERLHPLRRWRHAQNPRVSLRKLTKMLTDAEGRPILSYTVVARIEDGTLPPNVEFMRAVHELTGGEVRADHFVLEGATGGDAPPEEARAGG
mgnify:FL=1